MIHAFLIMAHNNWLQLQQLIKLIDSESHDIYIHIDKKCKDYDEEKLRNVALKSKVYFYQEHKVFWGGFSQVEVELFLFERACENHYDYYHLISGADLPLKQNEEMDAFFEDNKGLEFIDFDEEKLKNDPEISRRTRLFHFLQNFRRISQNKHVNAFFVFWERCLLLVQIILHIDRTRKLDWTIKYGSNWVSITDGLVREILSQRKKIEKVFKWTNCADEIFVQTVAFNSEYRSMIYDNGNNSEMNNMRLIDWDRGCDGSPYTFRNGDYELLKKTDALFARKFSEVIDKDIIIRVINGVENGFGL
jgi:hypothetical protein